MENGVKNGLYREYSEDGRLLIECYYSNDELDGEFKIYDSFGLSKWMMFENGIKIHQREYYSSGQLKLDSDFEGDVKNGNYFQMTEQGDTIYLGHFKKDTLYYEKIISNNSVSKVFFFAKLEVREVESDSVHVMVDFHSPTPIWNAAIVGRYDLNNDPNSLDFIDTLHVFKGYGRHLEFVIPKESVHDGRLNAHFVEYRSSEYESVYLIQSFDEELPLSQAF